MAAPRLYSTGWITPAQFAAGAWSANQNIGIVANSIYIMEIMVTSETSLANLAFDLFGSEDYDGDTVYGYYGYGQSSWQNRVDIPVTDDVLAGDGATSYYVGQWRHSGQGKPYQNDSPSASNPLMHLRIQNEGGGAADIRYKVFYYIASRDTRN